MSTRNRERARECSLPQYGETDPDTGQRFGVCMICNRAVTAHTEEERQDCLRRMDQDEP